MKTKMTRDEILNMPAGREMDALVWLALHGRIEEGLLTCRRVDGDIQPSSLIAGGHVSPPYYSEGIGAAWEVVEKLKSDGFSFEMEINVHGDLIGDYIVSGWRRDDMTINFLSRGKTAPLAICRAVLLCVLGV